MEEGEVGFDEEKPSFEKQPVPAAPPHQTDRPRFENPPVLQQQYLPRNDVPPFQRGRGRNPNSSGSGIGRHSAIEKIASSDGSYPPFHDHRPSRVEDRFPLAGPRPLMDVRDRPREQPHAGRPQQNEHEQHHRGRPFGPNSRGLGPDGRPWRGRSPSRGDRMHGVEEAGQAFHAGQREGHWPVPAATSRPQAGGGPREGIARSTPIAMRRSDSAPLAEQGSEQGRGALGANLNAVSQRPRPSATDAGKPSGERQGDETRPKAVPTTHPAPPSLPSVSTTLYVSRRDAAVATAIVHVQDDVLRMKREAGRYALELFDTWDRAIQV